MAVYQDTSCESVRAAAVAAALEWGALSMLVEAIICVSNIGLILLSMYLCWRILTTSVITQSMNDIMNFLLVIPIVACSLVTSNLWYVVCVTFVLGKVV